MSDVEALEGIRKTIEDLARLIRDSRTPSGTRKRAVRAVVETALSAIDTALAMVRERQAQTDTDEELV